MTTREKRIGWFGVGLGVIGLAVTWYAIFTGQI